jgi:hypothetical protein
LRAAESFRHAVLLSGLALLLAANIIELLPNSTLLPWTWLLVGTLLGASEASVARSRKQRREERLASTVLATEPRI